MSDNETELLRGNEEVSIYLDDPPEPPHIQRTSRLKHDINRLCENPAVDPGTFLRVLQEATSTQAQEQLNEPGWYYWQPIHFAARTTNAEKLQLVLDNLQVANQDVNALTAFSENALHVLLEYSDRAECFDVEVLFGNHTEVCRIVEVENPGLIRCVKLLIEAGVDINHNNIWNETPLAVAIKYKLLEAARLLHSQDTMDVDLSLVHLIKEYSLNKCDKYNLKLGIRNNNPLSSSKNLFTFLKSRQEHAFLRFNRENLRPHQDDTENGYFTMLQMCFLRGYLDCLNRQVTEDLVPITEAFQLKMFCQLGFPKCVVHLLNNGADIFMETKAFGGRDVFQMAVQLKYYPFLALLLGHGKSAITKPQLVKILNGFSQTSLQKDSADVVYVLVLLLSKLEQFNRTSKEELVKPLTRILDFYRNHNKNDRNRENILQVLQLGASLVPGNCRKEERKKINLSLETLRAHMDQCIDDNNDVHYDSLVQESEIEAFKLLKHDPKKAELLNHPIMVFLLHEKWLRCRKFFYWNLIFHAVFLLVLFVYIILVQVRRASGFCKAVFGVFVLIQAAKELAQVALFRKKYFKEPSNYLEIVAIVCCAFNIFARWPIAMVIAILFYSSVFLLMLGQLPFLAKYLIFFSSTRYFVEYTSFYLIQLVSFAVCFYILLNPVSDRVSPDPSTSDAMVNITLRLFNTMFYFMGQYDDQVMKVAEFPIFGRIVVALFAISMTIILNNLLVGLIVTDMGIIQKNGKIQRQIKMIQFISKLELFVEKFRYSQILRDIKIFDGKERKVLKNINGDLEEKFYWGFSVNVLDEEDKQWLNKIREDRVRNENTLKKVYEFIVNKANQTRRKLTEDQ